MLAIKQSSFSDMVWLLMGITYHLTLSSHAPREYRNIHALSTIPWQSSTSSMPCSVNIKKPQPKDLHNVLPNNPTFALHSRSTFSIMVTTTLTQVARAATCRAGARRGFSVLSASEEFPG